jgi:hypothetical protein
MIDQQKIQSPEPTNYNTVVDYINAWNDIYIKAVTDIETLIDKYYNSGSLEELHTFYRLLDAMRERSESHAIAIDFLYRRLKSNVTELL